MQGMIQDHMLQAVDDATTFENMMANVSAWVASRLAMQGIPMDVRQVDKDWVDEWELEDVAAVNAWTRCNACSGYGHIARDCPSKGKGGGKGNNGKSGSGKGECGKNGGYKGRGTSARVVVGTRTAARVTTARTVAARVTTARSAARKATARGTRACAGHAIR
jgi:hypothetical protein